MFVAATNPGINDAVPICKTIFNPTYIRDAEIGCQRLQECLHIEKRETGDASKVRSQDIFVRLQLGMSQSSTTRNYPTLSLMFRFGMRGGGGGGATTWIVLVEDLGRNALQHLTREDTQQLPADIQRFEHRAILVIPWNHRGDLHGREKGACLGR